MILIGLSGKAQNGKDTFADMITEVYPSSRKYAFADDLKAYCKLHHEELFKIYPHVPRTRKDDPVYGYTAMLQHIGTNITRTKNPNHWIDIVKKKIDKDNSFVSIVTDVRFPNEADWIKSEGGFLINLIRLNKDGSRFVDPLRDSHISENSLDNYPFDLGITLLDGHIDYLKLVASTIIPFMQLRGYGERQEQVTRNSQ